VFVDDSFRRRQTNAARFKFFGEMQALEYTEQFVGVLHVETYSVVRSRY
jgi:hypothetical protein